MNVMNAWKNAIRDIVAGRTFTDDEGRECHEQENMIVTINDLEDVPAPLQWLRGQSNWHLPSDDELKAAIFNFDNEEERYAYGSRIFSFRDELNQLDSYVIPLLREHPESRRALVALADPVADDVTVEKNYISLLNIWFRISEGKLQVTAVLRSNDFLLGWPANIYQIHLLQKYVAERIHIPCGAITTISLSAHFFEDERWLYDKLR